MLPVDEKPGELFGGEWSPFTSRIWYIEAPYEVAVAAVQEWHSGLPGVTRFERLSGQLETLFGQLEPWAMPSWKELLVATAGRWTALFSQGSDVPTLDVIASRLRCRSLRTSYAPHVARGGRVISYGDTAFTLCDGSRDDLAPSHAVRSIQASNQDRWEWDLYGEPQLFEEPALYTRRIIRERFDLAALNRYCVALGIDRAEPSSYGPEATLVTVDTSAWPNRSRTMPSHQWRAENS